MGRGVFRREMRVYTDEYVVVRKGKNLGDPSEVTINCPDKVGLGCDLARVVFEFGLSVTKGGAYLVAHLQAMFLKECGVFTTSITFLNGPCSQSYMSRNLQCFSSRILCCRYINRRTLVFCGSVGDTQIEPFCCALVTAEATFGGRLPVRSGFNVTYCSSS